jgi:hypothetical protein
MAIKNLFASKSITEHAVRGVIGIGALYGAAYALSFTGTLPFLATVGGLAIGLIALRGCPFCWSIGLINTVLNTAFKAKNCAACNDITQRNA